MREYTYKNSQSTLIFLYKEKINVYFCVRCSCCLHGPILKKKCDRPYRTLFQTAARTAGGGRVSLSPARTHMESRISAPGSSRPDSWALPDPWCRWSCALLSRGRKKSPCGREGNSLNRQPHDLRLRRLFHVADLTGQSAFVHDENAVGHAEHLG